MPSGQRARVDANLAALRLLRMLQEHDRPATASELPVLAAWSSWGAVPAVFDESKPEWAPVRSQLRELLTEVDYDAARRTTINAHYTDPRIAEIMWHTATRLGVTTGNVIEPGCGTGTFIGLAPETVTMTGVELDPTSAAIAAHLYPAATVRTESFADSRLHAGSFDAAIGNVPFGNVILHDPVHNQSKQSIHNHFLIKAVDLVQPGGIVIALTSSYTLDAQNPAARRELFASADLVGAIRLPTGAHRRTAGTDALTDLLILRKRLPGERSGGETWLRTCPIDLGGVSKRVNRYFVAHPDRVLGEMRIGHGMYGADTLTVAAPELGSVFYDRLQGTATELAEEARRRGLTADDRRPQSAQAVASAPDLSVAVGTVAFDPVAGFTRHTEFGPEPIHVPKSQRKELEALLGMGELAHTLLRAEAASSVDTAQITGLRSDLAAAYHSYVKRHGPINRVQKTVTRRIDKRTGENIISRRTPPVFSHLNAHPLTPLIRALEHFDEVTGNHTPAALLAERVVIPRRPPLGVDTADEAIGVAMDTDGQVTLARVAQLLGVDEREARDRLGELVYDDPAGGRIIPRAEYLSGNIRTKLTAAKEAVAGGNEKLAVNVAALEKVMPRQLGPAEITAQIGAVWISPDDHAQFLREILASRYAEVKQAGPAWWEVKAPKLGTAATSVWGTEHRSAGELFEAILNQKPIRVTTKDADGRAVLDGVATEAAREKADKLIDRFAAWTWEDPQRAARLADEYNKRFNSIVLRDYSIEGDRLTLPGLSAALTARPHQKAAVARMISEPSVGLFHEVGAGKTGEMVMGAMELKRLGMATKPVVVVPNHMLEQFSREWIQWYPRATVLAAATDDLSGDKRRELVARIATGDWDGVVMTRSAFKKLGMSAQAEADYQRRELAVMREALDNAKAAGMTRSVKQAEKALLREEERLKEKLDAPRDAGISFEETGIDYVIVDEAHGYKNLRTVSAIQEAGKTGSALATDLHMKLDYLRGKHGRRVATLATATPIANSITEAHVMLRYLRPDLLADAGVEPFDAWAATFGKQVETVEVGPGGNYRLKTRFASFQNVPELLRMWHVAADVKTAADLNLPKPLLAVRADGRRAPRISVIEPGQAMADYMQHLRDRIANLGSTFATAKGEDNMLAIVGDGRAAALDLRLVGVTPDTPQKVDVVADDIYHRWQATHDWQYADDTGAVSPTTGSLQLVFCDLSTPKADGSWSVYQELKDLLVAKGMPAAAIRFIHDAKNDAEKGRLFAAARAGDISVLVGSTEKMGTGTNVQNRAVALYHLDCPWRPADVEQRTGRALRQGNQNEEIHLVKYVAAGSFDTYNWQTIERKGTFIGQIMNPGFAGRDIEDIGDTQLSYQESTAASTGDPLVMEKFRADDKVAKLVRLEKAHRSEQSMLTWRADSTARRIEQADRDEPALAAAIAKSIDTKGDAFRATIDGRHYTERTAAAAALRDGLFRRYPLVGTAINVTCQLGGHEFVFIPRDSDTFSIYIAGADRAVFTATQDSFKQGTGGIQRLENRVTKLPDILTDLRQTRDADQAELAQIRTQIGSPFPRADQLAAARKEAGRLKDLIKARAAGPDPAADNADNPAGAGTGAEAAHTTTDSAATPTASPPVEADAIRSETRDSNSSLRHNAALRAGHRREQPGAGYSRS